MAWAAALYLVSAASSSSERLSSCWIAASWLRCSTRIMRCCLGMGMMLSPRGDRGGQPESAGRLDDQDPLADQVLAGAACQRWRGPVDVDPAPEDRAARVLGHEPAAVPVIPVGRDVDQAAQWDHPGVDGNGLVGPQR